MNKQKKQLVISNNSGFTLIELVVVIVILGILSVTALPKFINIKSDANEAVMSGAVGSIKSAVSLFKAKTLTSGSGFTDEVEFSGVKGSNYLPWAATATAIGFTDDYSSPPEIFEGAGINVDDWAYRIYISSGSYAVVATPRRVLDEAEPTEAEVKATNCYFVYHWKNTGEPIITTISSGC
jgi:MSHA pilin protein MshA